MNYRFQKITTVYPEFAEQFLTSQPDIRTLSYQQLHDRFVEQHYGWADYYARHLGKLGNDTQEIFASLEPLQKAWARKHGVRYTQRHWLKEIAMAQVLAFQPDVIFLQDLYLFDETFRRSLRELLGRRAIIIGFRAAPTDDYNAFKDLDLALTCAPNYVDAMRRHGSRADLLLHAFEPSVLESLGSENARDLDFTFVGSLIQREGFHRQRFELVSNLMKTTPLQVWGKVTEPKPQSISSRAAARAKRYANHVLRQTGISYSLSGVWEPFRGRQRSQTSSTENGFRPGFHRPVFGLDNFRILARSKLTLNNHIDCAGSYAGNVRLFEATGAGACLITDWKKNLSELFEPDVQVVAYKNVEECVEKVKYLLDHPSEHAAIGAAGQRRTLRDHTFAQRAEQLDSLIRKLL